MPCGSVAAVVSRDCSTFANVVHHVLVSQGRYSPLRRAAAVRPAPAACRDAAAVIGRI